MCSCLAFTVLNFFLAGCVSVLTRANVKEELNEEEDGDVVDKSEEDFNFFKQFLLKYLKNNLKKTQPHRGLWTQIAGLLMAR